MRKAPLRFIRSGAFFWTGLRHGAISIKCPYGYTLGAYTCLDTPTHTKMTTLCEGGTSF